MGQIKAYAKINLGLNVYKLRQNETKHQIESFFVLDKSIYNVINIKKSNELKIKYIYREKLNPITIKKALVYLKDKYKIDINYEIEIKKNIPLSSGLGGSSTDVAAITKYVMDQNNLKLSGIDYEYFALNVSSDMPFFLSEYKFAYVSNFGDKLEQLDDQFIPHYEIIPSDISMNTKSVFNEFDKLFFNNIGNDYIKLKSNLKKIDSVKFFNDLEEPAFNLEPSLAGFKQHDTVMTGSGSFFIRLKENNDESKN